MIPRPGLRAILGSTVVWALVLSAPHALATGQTPGQTPGHPGQDPCDPGLERASDNPMAYQPRQDRCEGLYRLKVNSDKILIKSWTARFEDFDPAAPQPLELSWSVPPGTDEPVHLRATALKAHTFYRMDTRLADTATPWSWPTSLLGQLRLGRTDLGVLGWTSTEASACDDKIVYLPLEIRQKESAPSAEYRVALVPGERLQEVDWSLAPLLASGSEGGRLGDEKELGYGYYPAALPTVFTVPAPPEPGLYVLNLRAHLRSNEWATRRLCFYHPGGLGGDGAATTGGGGVR